MNRLNQKGFHTIEALLFVVFVLVAIYFISLFIHKHMENTRKDSIIDSAYIFVDMVRNQLAADNELPDLDRGLLVSYKHFKAKFKKGGKSPYDNNEYDPEFSYVAITNNGGKMKFYVTLQDQSKNCLILLDEEDVQNGSRKMRKYIRKGADCKITSLNQQDVITSIIYKGGEEENIEYIFSVY